jgi:aminopeptidase N
MINRVLIENGGWLLALVLVLVFALPASSFAATAGPKPATSARVVLPAAVTPDRYRIDITPDAAALTFKGSVQIDLTVHQPSNKIVLNSADIVIDSAALSGAAHAPAISYDERVQTATFALSQTLKPGAYTLSLVYHGKIYQQSSGLFALDYETANGKARAVFTQFENSDARRFVPSWDEPGRKAIFELTATVPANLMPLSNMPIASTDALPGDLKRVHFAPTPKMSSYLLFFGMGDFERVNRTVDGVDVGVVVKRGDTGSAAYALDAAAHILPYYNSYFGTPFPLPKLDLIAGPGTSAFFGAMENWGAIFYFERDLLIDPRISTENDKQNVYVVVAHEMAHQWFGDLVTMAWWDDLWLNEGFASWMETKVTDHFHPEWKLWLQTLATTQGAMQEDARDGTHPIITPINDVQQASGAFDNITYYKGAAVILTLESYLGEDAFRAGVRRYMHDHAYGNTVTDDLWREMDRDSSRPITQIAHDLTLQAGLPMVSELSAQCAGGATTLMLAQSHFAIDANSTKARVWHVPVAAATLGGPSTTAVISGSAPKAVQMSGCGAVILNAGQSSYFRARYSNQGLAALTGHYGALSSADQLGLLNDTSSLAYIGDEPMAALMDLTKNIPADVDPVVGIALVGLLQQLDDVYDGLSTQASFRSYAVSVLRPMLARVGWDRIPGESDNTALARSELIAGLGEFGDPAVLAQATQRFQRYEADAASLEAGARRTVLRVVAMHADQSTWNRLHVMAKSAKTALERQELYDLLATAQDRGLTQQALDLALSGEPPTTMVPEMIAVAAHQHPDMALDFAIAHWDKLTVSLEPTTQAAFVPRLVLSASDIRLIGKLNAFAAAHIAADARQDVRKSVSNVRYLASIREQRLPEVDRWLKDHQQ